MPRHGQNPMRWVDSVHKPAGITLTTVVFIPHQEGYFRESLSVLKLCLESIRTNTQPAFDLLVFDNGSCEEVRTYLLDQFAQGNIDYLILSKENIGKVGALNVMLPAAPGRIVGFTDSDVFFRPGWLEASLEVLNAFPKAGMVTAQPARRDLKSLCWATLDGVHKANDISLEEGNLLPEAYVRACNYGLGIPTEQYNKRIEGLTDVRVCKGDVSAYVSADHFQYILTREVINRIVPFEVTMALGREDYQVDEKIEEAGFWRLSTEKYLVHHIGNRMPDLSNLADEERWVYDDLALILESELNLPHDEHSPAVNTESRLRQRIRKSRLARRVLKRINAATYNLLYE